MTPFPLDGGRAGDGGDGADVSGHPHRPPKLLHAAGAVGRARHLRRDMTLGEKVLWKELRRLDLHVRRQVPMGRYVADFAIHAARLIVEVDGPQHEQPDQVLHDAQRTERLASQGYRVLRFTSAEVLKDAPAVALKVQAAALSPPSPALPPSRGKGES